MQVDDIISEVDDHGFADESVARKIAALNWAIKDIANRKLWTFLDKVVTLTFNGSSATPTNAPTDLRAARKMIDLSQTNPRRINYKRIDDMEEHYNLSDAGTPYFYYFEGTTLKVYQIPGASQTLRFRYAQVAPTVVSGGAESTIIIPSQFHEALVLRTVIRLYMMEDDTDMAAAFKPLYDEQLAVMSEAYPMAADDPEYVHAIDWDDYDYMY